MITTKLDTDTPQSVRDVKSLPMFLLSSPLQVMQKILFLFGLPIQDWIHFVKAGECTVMVVYRSCCLRMPVTPYKRTYYYIDTMS